MARNPKDNFKKSDIEKLRSRVGNRCSNPEHRIPTTGPSKDSIDKVNIIGQAAHICAASEGGPRYDSSMSSEERSSMNNAIWLCSNCATEIDKDVTKYSIKLLYMWKKESEDMASKELGQKQPSHTETIETVRSTLTGVSTNFIANAIPNVHQASALALESIDPRFRVESSYDKNGTAFSFHAKEDVDLAMTMTMDKNDQSTFQELMDHGREFKINPENFIIKGSKLFDKLLKEDYSMGHISFSPIEREAIQKLWLVDKETGDIEFFDDIHGTISSGSKSFTFTGTACNNHFMLNYQKFFGKNVPDDKLNMSINFEMWEGKRLQDIQYLDKFLSIFSKMQQGWEIFTALEINGSKLLSGKGTRIDTSDYVRDTNNILNYTSRCMTIAEFLQHNVKFTSNVSYTSKEHRHIAEVASIIKGEYVFNSNSFKGTIATEFIVDEQKRDLFADKEISLRITDVQPAGEKVKLFDIELELPEKITSFDHIAPKVDVDLEKVNNGDTIKVEWIPEDNFSCEVSYNI